MPSLGSHELADGLEIIGKDPAKLRSYFGDLFGWEFDTSSLVAKAVSELMNYGLVNRITTTDGTGIPGWRRRRRGLRRPCGLLGRRSRCRGRPACCRRQTAAPPAGLFPAVRPPGCDCGFRNQRERDDYAAPTLLDDFELAIWS